MACTIPLPKKILQAAGEKKLPPNRNNELPAAMATRKNRIKSLNF